MNDDGVFDAAVAQTYDQVHTGAGSLAQMVDQLALFASDGRALEFAIGTGRVALPLKAKGIDVEGIELSRAMVEVLHTKDPTIAVRIGDMTTEVLDKMFSLVFLVYNTIDNLTSQDAQVSCFANAAQHLKPGGRFVVETLLPQIQKLPFGQTLHAHSCTDTHWGIDDIDIATQTYTSHHMRFDGDQATRLSVPFRYAWPAEMDLMARMAGLTLESRWADWSKTPFDRFSTSHVSVWRKPEAAR